jgi:carbon-monoxide dehydrogenase small subunit
MMELKLTLNGKPLAASVEPDCLLIDFLRAHGCLSVKRGCETSGCGLCTVHMDGKPVLSCSVLAAQADGHTVTTLEGLQKEAEEFGGFLADQGGEQCGFCSPGFIMNVLAMERELENPGEEEILEYLSGNLCRCTGYAGQLRAIVKYLNRKKEGEVQGRGGEESGAKG